MTDNLNRAFMYGESVFTTTQLVNGTVRDWDLHFERLSKGVEFVYGPFIDESDWVEQLKNRLEGKFQDLQDNKILRITVYREQQRGLLRNGFISVSDLKVHLHSTPLDPQRYEEKMIKLRTCPVLERPHWWPSFLKAGNYFDTILRQKIYLKSGDDDVLFLSSQDTVLESSVANIFTVRHNKLFTAPTGPNVLEGVMRKKVIDVAHDYFETFTESETTIEQLLKADAIFGANSVRGIFLVDRIDDHDITYGLDFLEKFKSLRRRVFHE